MEFLCLRELLSIFLYILSSTPFCHAQKSYYLSRSCDTHDVSCGWWCKTRRCNSEGHIDCRCPGNGLTARYRIACHCCASGNYCTATHGWQNAYDGCSKFDNCASCHNNVGQWNGGCGSCMTGYQMSSSRCSDMNECSARQLNRCAHHCTNTIGSFYCSCYTGYYLQSDRRGCAKRSCGYPGAVANGNVIPTENYLFNSYVSYTCRSPLILVGNAIRKCIAPSSSNVIWTGSAPHCYDSCATSTNRQCGLINETSAEQCKQLGCCYDVSKGCFFAAESPSLVFREDRSANVRIRQTFTEETAGGCSMHCRRTAWCRSFVIHRKSSDAVAHQDCYMFDESRTQLIASSNLVFGNQASDLHEPMKQSYTSLTDHIDRSMLYVGCYDDFSPGPGFSYRVWSSKVNTPERCISTCRLQSFTIAALEDGTECYCDVKESLSYRNESSSECSVPCPGYPSMTCGSTKSSSVYRVPSDSNYVGCFTGESNKMSLVWKAYINSAASMCADNCLKQGFKYAAVQNASRCHCGNDLEIMSNVHYDKCRSQCSDDEIDNCPFAVYSTGLADVLSPTYSGKQPVRHLYHGESNRLVEIPLQLFTEFSTLKPITTSRLVLRATESVITPSEDTLCRANPNCYKLCGEVTSKRVSGIDNKGADQIVRLFHINLANLRQYVGSDAQRVFVYAQTVVIDRDLEFPFSLQVYTRQLILDRSKSSKARTIRVSGTAATLSLNFREPMTFGVKADSTFLKQSLMCARILIDTRQQNNTNTAWAILHDLAHNHHSFDVETSAWMKSVQAFNAFLSGIDRQGIRFVPYYSKLYFKKQLDTYFDAISVYNNDYDRLVDKTLSMADFIKHTSEMTKIYSTTSVEEAKSDFEGSQTAVHRSANTYKRLRSDYELAAEAVIKTADAVDAGKKRQLLVSIINGFIKLGQLLAKKKKMADERRKAEDIARQLQNELKVQLQNFAENLEKTEQTIKQLYRFMDYSQEVSNELQKTDTKYDFSAFISNVDTTGQLKSNAVHWKTLRNNIHVVLSHPKVFNVKGRAEYMRTAMDMCEWGEALSNSAVEHSELLRDAIQKRYTLIAKQEEAARYKEYVDKLQKNQIPRQHMIAAMEEQLHDVRLDLNDALFSYCQAYFYENMKECEQSYKPAFGGSLSDLLLKIKNVVRGSLSITSTPSSVSRFILITDRVSGNETCTDAAKCPVKTFKETGVMHFKMPINHTGLSDLSRYRVSEVQLVFVGAKRNATTKNEALKVGIESSGVFYSKDNNRIYNFLTTPLSLAYEYEVETNHISIRADVYPASRAVVQHITPFTTWIIRLSDRSRDIDLTELDGVRMRFVGSASNDEKTHKLQVNGAGIDDPREDILLHGDVRDVDEEERQLLQQQQRGFEGDALDDDADHAARDFNSAIKYMGK